MAVFLATRIGIALVAYLSAPIVADNPVGGPYHLRGTENTLVDVFGSRWDTGFYVSIVEEGYRYQGVKLPSVPFFPLLPLAMRALLPLIGDAVLSGILVANLSLLGAAILFHRLVDLRWGAETADRAVWYVLIFPVSFFGSAIYSESLFLLSAIAALLLARGGRWAAAGAAGFLAGLSRFMGLIVAPLLFVEWLVRRSGPGGDRAPRAGFLAAAAVPLGTLAYTLYLQVAFGDPLAFLNGSAAWGREPASPLGMIAALFAAPEGGWAAALAGGGIHLDNWTDALFVLAFLGMGVVLFVKKEWPEAVFVLLG
ncbi:MAG TPA: mannosyltransferase family protein, partial [Anaerolineales bacterium]|nr:mannosyltransferase family protein [Anaerolineales bacterium]